MIGLGAERWVLNPDKASLPSRSLASRPLWHCVLVDEVTSCGLIFDSSTVILGSATAETWAHAGDKCPVCVITKDAATRVGPVTG